MMEKTAHGPEQLPTCMRQFKRAADDPEKRNCERNPGYYFFFLSTQDGAQCSFNFDIDI